MDLKGTAVIITGAASGIGRAACDVFAATGAHVVAMDLHQAGTAAAAAAVGGTAVSGDVSDEQVWARAVEAATEHGGLSIAYLNAGLSGFTGPIEELPRDLYDRTVAANITGVVIGTQACVPAMRARGGGALVATASVAGIIAFKAGPVYTMTKHAVTGFVTAMAPNLARDNITFDAVCPAGVDTPMSDALLGDTPKDELAVPLIDPADIARTALELATSEGTGRCRPVLGMGNPADWTFPTFADLLRTSPA